VSEPLITFRFPEPPPSSNKIYFVMRGRKVLTKPAKAWKTRFITSLGGVNASEFMDLQFSLHQKFHLVLWIYLTEKEILNASYGKSRSAKYPYAKVDVSNFIKLSEDAVSELLAVSCDRQNFGVTAYKALADERGSRLVMHLFPHNEEKKDPWD
jgi:Holliday junction resolvase RusA-like endonuclease